MASPPIRLASMGMFIIDTFQFLDPTTGQDLGSKGLEDQIGGGGCYFAIGARVWLPPSDIQMIIDRGSDWRTQDQAVLDRFNRTAASPSPDAQGSSMWHYRSRPDGTTRAVNIYKGEQRGFDYLSPKIRLEPSDLLQCSPSIPPRLPEWIHLICSPERALETISQIDAVFAQTKADFPKLVYEPIPDSCVFANLQDCLRVLPRLAVFSPNHEEAAELLGLRDDWEDVLKQAAGEKSTSSDDIVNFITTKLAGGFAAHLQQQHIDEPGPIICIRSGAWGSVVGRADVGFHHVPAWHTPSESSSDSSDLDTSSSRIKDVTGAGNSFLGGFSAYLVQTEQDGALDPTTRMKEAAMHGAVSASLVIEQLGLPSFDVREGEELWNGHTAADRLALSRQRLSLA
ncbi:related to MAK32 protein [Sporisorium reilianum f. sp. reilianum]|uniref:Related to MAK32 protein n=1 Tax=Sporisorium reilianum f. sp. reilianum TaxID=72559 RepID=A0A2N8UEV9_9BASI|nr:related to MAK32 protein [Sporisorium reilianum f. sp. reilianum]